MSIAVDSPVNCDYERDPEFISYLETRLAAALAAQKDGRLIDAEDVFATIRQKHGWDSGR